MVIGVIPNSSSVETLLNNLQEADFALKDVSVIMADLKARNAIAKDAGPLKGVTPDKLAARLTQAGLSQQDAATISGAVNKGQVLVAIAPPKGSEQAAAAILKDYNPVLVKVI